MKIPFIGHVGWKHTILAVIVAATVLALLSYFVQLQGGKNLLWCAAKWEKCSIARELDSKQIQQARDEAGL